MAARLQRHIKCCSLGAFCQGCDCVPFCMKLTTFFVIPFPDNTSILYDHGTNHRVWICPSTSFFCQFNCTAHVKFICHFFSFLISPGKAPEKCTLLNISGMLPDKSLFKKCALAYRKSPDRFSYLSGLSFSVISLYALSYFSEIPFSHRIRPRHFIFRKIKTLE